MNPLIHSVQNSRKILGIEKLKLGTVLCLIQENESWKEDTVSSTFRGWLKEQNIEPNSAFQYMKVAQKYICELNVSNEVISRLALVGMSVLEKSLSVVTSDNVEEVVGIMTSMPRAEAIEELESMEQGEESLTQIKTSKTALKVLRAIEDLSHSSKIEVLNQIKSRSMKARPQ